MILSTQDFTLSPLSLTAKVKLRAWVREETIAEARKRIDLYGDLLDPSERRKIITGALELLDSGQAEKILLDTDEGRRMVAWLHLLPKHPQVTLEQAGDLVPYLAGKLSLFDAKVEAVNGLHESSAAPAATEVPEPILPPLPPRKQVSPEDRRKAVFDKMVAHSGINLKGLVDLPIAAAAAIYLQVAGGREVNHLKLKARLYEYAKATGALDEPAQDSGEIPKDVVALVEQLNAKSGQSLESLIQTPPQ